MKNYEVTFIVDPVLSGDEIKSTAKTYEDMLTTEGANIVHVDHMGLKQLAYPINRRSSGIYFAIEYNGKVEQMIPKIELALRRDERIMRFLTIKLDKYGIKFNEDKRAGKFAKRKKDEAKADDQKANDKPKAKAAAPVKATAPVATPPPVPISSSTEEE